MKGWSSLPVGELRGQGVEQFGRSEAFVSLLDHQLFLLDHMHELDPNEGSLGCLERFEPQHEPCHPFYCSVILFHHIIQILHLADGDSRAVLLVIAFDGGFIGVTAVNRDRLGEPVAADRLLQKPERGRCVPVLGEQKVNGLAVFIHRAVEIAPLALHLDVGLVDVIVTTRKILALVFHTQVYKLKRKMSKNNLPASVSSLTFMQPEVMEVHDENPAYSLPAHGSRSAPSGTAPQSTHHHSGTSGGPRCK